MKLVSNMALAAALALGGLGASPALAQQVSLGKEERAALLALSNALQARDYATATRALDSAQSTARSGYARYLASSLQLKLGIDTNNIGLQQTAIDAMIGSGAAPAADLPMLYRNQGALQQQAGKLDRAEAAYARLLEVAPGDEEGQLALAQVKHDRKKPLEAIALIDRVISARQAAGQAVPEAWYKRGLNIALINKLAPQALKLSRELVTAYPTPANWRDAVLVYRDMAQPDPAAALDSWRLTRAAKALAGERDYLEFARALSSAGVKGEAKAVLDEGVSAKMVDPAQPASKALIATATKEASSGKAGLASLHSKAMAASTGAAALSAGDAHFAYGDYAKAAALYPAAIAKGSVEVNVANTRLGIALAMAGQRSEAQTAFSAVTGPRSELASLWLAWLSRRA